MLRYSSSANWSRYVNRTCSAVLPVSQSCCYASFSAATWLSHQSLSETFTSCAAVVPEVSVEGFCSNMCPDYQLQSRTANANENSLEVIDPLGHGRGIEQLATKKFERNVGLHNILGFQFVSDVFSTIVLT